MQGQLVTGSDSVFFGDADRYYVNSLAYLPYLARAGATRRRIVPRAGARAALAVLDWPQVWTCTSLAESRRDERQRPWMRCSGRPESGWDGAARDIARDGRTAAGGRSLTGDRHLLLPAFHAVQDRVGLDLARAR